MCLFLLLLLIYLLSFHLKRDYFAASVKSPWTLRLSLATLCVSLGRNFPWLNYETIAQSTDRGIHPSNFFFLLNETTERGTSTVAPPVSVTDFRVLRPFLGRGSCKKLSVECLYHLSRVAIRFRVVFYNNWTWNEAISQTLVSLQKIFCQNISTVFLLFPRPNRLHLTNSSSILRYQALHTKSFL